MKSLTFVFPNRSAIGLGAVLLAMWYAGASQNNGAAFLLCFVLTALTLSAIPSSWANVRGLEVRAEPIKPVFVGDDLRIVLHVSNPTNRPRYALRIGGGGDLSPGDIAFLDREKSARAETFSTTARRGLVSKHSIAVSSAFPIGFISSRTAVELNQPAYVYPKPEGVRPLPMTFDPARDTREGNRAEGDDYAGVRMWIPGESMRHIDWKAVSRGQPMMTKQWTSDAGHRLVLGWDQVRDLSYEARISQLARWVIDAENQGLDYGMAIPGTSLNPSRGEHHFHACLQALATLPAGDDEPAAVAVPEHL